MGRYPELDLSPIRTTPLHERESLVSVEAFAPPDGAGADRDPLAIMPDILAGRDLRRFSDKVVSATGSGKGLVLLLGGHVVKTGVGPCLLRLMRAGVVRAFAGNGAVAVHDVEIALAGKTSERVDAALPSGDFGVATETAEILNRAAREARLREEGLGEAVGRLLSELEPPYVAHSLLAAAYRAGRPFTLHVAIGTDVIHQHPGCDGAALGEATLRDFRILAAVLAGIDGGVVANLGSAVVLPEVFLKALNVARNLGHASDRIVTANFDFIQHYRPRLNVLLRPTAAGGEAFAFTGHHEILIPLLTEAVLYRLGLDR